MRLFPAIATAALFTLAAPPAAPAQGAEKGKAHEVVEGNIRSFDLADDRFVLELVPAPKHGDTTRTFRVTDATAYHLDDKEAARDDAIRPGARARVSFSPSRPGVALKVRTWTSTAGEPRAPRHHPN